MASRDRTTLGIGLIVAMLAVSAREYIWLQFPLAILALFFIVWGRAPKGTEAFIGRLPAGGFLLQGLAQIDLVLSPRDLELDKHIHGIVAKYTIETRAALRRLLNTRNPNSISDPFLSQFTGDGLIERHGNGHTPVKNELRESLARALDNLGA